MIWSSFSEFIHMHGYGFYVWGSFVVTSLVLLVEHFILRQQRKKIIFSEEL
jgi:heme exporter protein D